MRARALLPLAVLAAATLAPHALASGVLYDWTMELAIGRPHRALAGGSVDEGAPLFVELLCGEGAMVQVEVVTAALEGIGSVACSSGELATGSFVATQGGNVLLVITGQGTRAGDPAVAHALVVAQ